MQQIFFVPIEMGSKKDCQFEHENKHLKGLSGVSPSLKYSLLKGTLMQIWKSPYMFVFKWKQYPENSALLIQRILELFVREVCKFLKK